MLAKSKLNSIETLIDTEISHEEFVGIFKAKENTKKMKKM